MFYRFLHRGLFCLPFLYWKRFGGAFCQKFTGSRSNTKTVTVTGEWVNWLSDLLEDVTPSVRNDNTLHNRGGGLYPPLPQNISWRSMKGLLSGFLRFGLGMDECSG
ncbi:MAG TPA: hypothetical protein PKD52_06810 [Clostridiales bacterium]|nr:hypothetical protein [Clostridiales bacterium]